MSNAEILPAESFLDGKVTLFGGDNRDVLRSQPDCSVDSVVTDPPYALVSIVKRFGGANAAPAKGRVYSGAMAGFMGKQWDTGEVAFATEFWAECLRVLKPGGHVVAFSGTRTYHRLACAIEDAGFEIRDQLAWCYGSGFPKSHDVAKGIAKRRDDRAAILAVTTFIAEAADRASKTRSEIDAAMGTSDMAGWWTSRLINRCQCPKLEQWAALKALLGFGDDMDAEVARLNARKGEVSDEYKAAPIIGEHAPMALGFGDHRFSVRESAIRELTNDDAKAWEGWGTALKPAWEPICLARKPLIGTVADNVLEHGTGAINIDGCRVPTNETITATRNVALGSAASGVYGSANVPGVYQQKDGGRFPANVLHDGSPEVVAAFIDGEESAARFFYTAKADAHDRAGSKHPTVKPVDLMQWAVRLVTPPGGVTLDPFAGTGTTGEAAFREGMRAILIEREPEYQDDIRRRMRLALAGPDERRRESIKAKEADKPFAPGSLFEGL